MGAVLRACGRGIAKVLGAMGAFMAGLLEAIWRDLVAIWRGLDRIMTQLGPVWDGIGAFCALAGLVGAVGEICAVERLAPSMRLTPASLDVLRAYRDQRLARRFGGRVLIRTYYRLSPLAWAVLRDRPRLQQAVRVALMPAIGWASRRVG
jgi:hypothetical protein